MQARLRLELSQVPTTLASAPSQPRWILPSTRVFRPPCRYPAAECCTLLLAGARAQRGAAGADRRDTQGDLPQGELPEEDEERADQGLQGHLNASQEKLVKGSCSSKEHRTACTGRRCQLRQGGWGWGGLREGARDTRAFSRRLSRRVCSGHFWRPLVKGSCVSPPDDLHGRRRVRDRY